MLITLSILFAGIILSGLILLALSPGKPVPFLDENGKQLAGSLSEKIWVNINGVPQGMFIKSKDVNHPVLLFVHGGPGMTEYWITQQYPTGLEDLFTVVWWDQRGAGLSYQPKISPETMTVDQFVSDTLAVSEYLCERFGKEKIFMMAHSWGSFIGIQAVAQAPQLFHAYIGVGQLSQQIQSEQLAYEYALEAYKNSGNLRMLRKLESAPPSNTAPLPRNYEAIRDLYMHDLGIGTTRDMNSVITGLFFPSFNFREFTLGEKINLWRGKIFARSKEINLWGKMLTTDMTQTVTDLEVPVYFFHGKYDYTCAYPLAQAYFDLLNAPVKGFYTFKNSAHTPVFEEPEFTLKILKEDVLQGATLLADSN